MSNPNILFIDDGELDDVRAIVDGVGVEYTRWGKEQEREKLPPRLRILITTGSHAVHHQLERAAALDDEIWIATADSLGERRRLLQLGFNYVVRRPVHPSALRMLLQCAIYGGADRRGRRVAVGAPITFRSGLRRRRATLVDLSARGCRLLCAQGVPKGSDITVTLPAELAGGRALGLKGEVVRSHPDKSGDGRRSENTVAVRFRPIPDADRPLVAGILVSLSDGPATWDKKDNDSSGPQASLNEMAEPESPERRREPRGAYDGRVAPEGFPDQPFVGMDLSAGGLRVHSHSALSLGAHVRLVINDEDSDDSVLVAAEVIRVDDSGAAFAFDWIEDGGVERLTDIVARLPRIDSNADDSQGSIFTRPIPNPFARSKPD